MPYAHLTEQIGDKNQHYYSWVQCRGAQWQFGNGEGGRGDLGADCRHISELARMGEGLTANHHPYRHHHHHQNWDIGLLLLYSGGGLYLPGAKSSRLTFNSESWKRPGKVWSTMVLSHQWREISNVLNFSSSHFHVLVFHIFLVIWSKIMCWSRKMTTKKGWREYKASHSFVKHNNKAWRDWSGRSLVSAFYSWMIFPDWAFFCPAGSHFRRGGGDGGNPLRAAAGAVFWASPPLIRTIHFHPTHHHRFTLLHHPRKEILKRSKNTKCCNIFGSSLLLCCPPPTLYNVHTIVPSRWIKRIQQMK